LKDKLYANVSHDYGTTFEPEVEIDPALDPCNCCTTSCVYGPDGRPADLTLMRICPSSRPPGTNEPRLLMYPATTSAVFPPVTRR
jgi:hypothetical protein